MGEGLPAAVGAAGASGMGAAGSAAVEAAATGAAATGSAGAAGLVTIETDATFGVAAGLTATYTIPDAKTAPPTNASTTFVFIDQPPYSLNVKLKLFVS